MNRLWNIYAEHKRSSQNGSRSSELRPGSARKMEYHYRHSSSVASHAHSAHSQATSNRHILAGMSTQLDPPSAPFAQNSSNSSSSASISKNDNLLKEAPPTPLSLSVNYLPSKFSTLGGGPRKRKNKGVDGVFPKQGGGREAFRSGEARMPGDEDDDYDGVNGNFFGSSQQMRWNKFKWALFVSIVLLSLYSLIALIFCLLTWFNVWTHADIIRVGNRPELVISTLAAALGVVTSLIGWSGLLLNNRSFLAIYTFLLWVCFALLVAPGYMTYKRRTFNLEGKINAQWSRGLGTDGRLRVQNQLECCGYFSPFVEASVSQTCYARSILPGCKKAYIAFERLALSRWYAVSFSLVPLHIAIMVAGLLCSNHVTYRFGKGMMPKAYRLSVSSMAVIMENYANQLAEQYGIDVATEALARSRSNLAVPFASGTAKSSVLYSPSKYEGERTPDSSF